MRSTRAALVVRSIALTSMTAATAALVGQSPAATHDLRRVAAALLPGGPVAAVAQTPDGQLWIGTFVGLVRFDGTATTTFTPAEHPSLRSCRITALCSAADGRLWIGTEDQGLLCRDHGEFVRPGGARSVPLACIRQLALDPSGRLFGAGDAGLWWVDGERFGRVPKLHEPVQAMAVVGADDLWLATRDRLLQLRAGELTELDRGAFSALQRGSDGMVWVGSADGTLQRRSRDGRIHWSGAAGSAIGALALAADGDLWVAADQVLRCSGDTLRRVGNPTPALRVRCALADREGSMWFGGDGLWCARSTPLAGMQLPAGTAFPRTVCADRRGRLWVALYDDSLWLAQQGAFRPIGAAAGVRAQSLAPARDGGLWVASGHGIWRLDDDGARVERFEPRLPQGLRRAVLEDATGNLWVGCDDQLAKLPAEGLRPRATAAARTPHLLSPRDGLPGGEVTALLEAAPGRLWVGSALGLARIEQGRVVAAWQRGRELPHGEVRALHSASDGGLWIGTYGGGLAHLSTHGSVAVLDTDAGLAETVVSRIADTGTGNLLLQGNRGISLVAEAELLRVVRREQAMATVRVFDRGPGIGTFEGTGGHMPTTTRAPDGAFWFPTTEGLARIDPQAVRALAPPPVRIDAVVVAGTTLAATAADATPLVVPPGVGDLEVHFAAASFQQPDPVRLRYRLEGHDDGWVDAGSRRVATFAGLPPGDYRFTVQAAHDDGTWSDASAQLRLPPLLQASRWFVLLLGVAGAALLLVAVRWRSRAAWRRERCVDALVLARTTELRRANEQLAANLRSSVQRVAWFESQAQSAPRPSVAGVPPAAATAAPSALPVTIDPEALLRGMRGMLRRLVPDSIGLRFQFAAGPLLVRLDQATFERLLVDLVVSVADATVAASHIDVETDRVPLGEGDDRGCFAVTVTGAGTGPRTDSGNAGATARRVVEAAGGCLQEVWCAAGVALRGTLPSAGASVWR